MGRETRKQGYGLPATDEVLQQRFQYEAMQRLIDRLKDIDAADKQKGTDGE